jgi:hypothetical protein
MDRQLSPYVPAMMLENMWKAAQQDSVPFLKQSGATKLEGAEKREVQVNFASRVVPLLIDVVDDSAAQIEYKDKIIKYYNDSYGEVNREFLDSEPPVIRTPEKEHAKRFMMQFCLKNYPEYCDNNKSGDQALQPPSTNARKSK